MGVSLSDAVTTGDSLGRSWATPTAAIHQGTTGPPGERRQRDLREDVRWRTTPGANDWKGSARPGQRRGQLDEQVSHRFHPDLMILRGAPSSSGGPSSRPRLNPNFVDWLMGWVPGWTACEPLGTGSFRSKLPSLSGTCGGDLEEHHEEGG